MFQMRYAIALALVILLVFPPASDASIGVVPLVGIGFIGLKVYLGMRLLGSSATLLRHSLQNYWWNSIEDADDNDDDDDGDEDKRSYPTADRLVRINKRNTFPADANAFPRLNPEILKFIHQIDDDQCFEKFICQLGADRKAFGSFGMNVALMLEFYSSDRKAWYTKAMAKGRKLKKKELCPGRCESDDIKKIVNYISKELFANT